MDGPAYRYHHTRFQALGSRFRMSFYALLTTADDGKVISSVYNWNCMQRNAVGEVAACLRRMAETRALWISEQKCIHILIIMCWQRIITNFIPFSRKMRERKRKRQEMRQQECQLVRPLTKPKNVCTLVIMLERKRFPIWLLKCRKRHSTHNTRCVTQHKHGAYPKYRLYSSVLT